MGAPAALVLASAAAAVTSVAVPAAAPTAYPLCSTMFPGYLDVRQVPPDLVVPPTLNDTAPAAGLRVREAEPSFAAAGSGLYHALYLPRNWSAAAVAAGARWPMLVEWGGNGPWTSPFGDASCGLPDCTNLGYGISAGDGYIWLSLPYADLGNASDWSAPPQRLQRWWWGCPEPVAAVAHCPGYWDTNATLTYAARAVAHVAAAWGGDASRAVLLGFSRGALAVNYLGLHDDATAALWRASVAYAHYDGRPADQVVPYPAHDPASAATRLARLWGRPQYIVEEVDGAFNQTLPYLASQGYPVHNGTLTFAETGYCNHNDAWTLRPGAQREALRRWVARVVA